MRRHGTTWNDRRVAGKATRIEYSGAVHPFITAPGQEEAFDRAVGDAVRFME